MINRRACAGASTTANDCYWPAIVAVLDFRPTVGEAGEFVEAGGLIFYGLFTSRLYEGAQRMPWLLANGRTLRAELDAVEQPVSERLAAVLKELQRPTTT